MARWRAATALLFTIGFAAAQQVPDMSGTWRLNVEKSTWGKHPKPSAATVSIEHREPSYKYAGQVIMGLGSEHADARSFEFAGAIDGQEYPVAGSAGSGKLAVKRVNPYTIESEMRGADGKVLETARTVISPDGKRLIRTMKAAGPEGEVHWTEVYDRQR
jgi:hypothetical protein